VSEVKTFRCDVCGKLKKEANHWFRALVYVGPRFEIVSWGAPSICPQILNGWIELNPVQQHLCGMECAQKAMAKAMQEGK